jgi:ribosomal protein L37AE/L43A
MRAITCPGCGSKFDRTLLSLKSSDVVTCPGCRKQFRVRRYKAQAAAAAAFRNLTGFANDPKGS